MDPVPSGAAAAPYHDWPCPQALCIDLWKFPRERFWIFFPLVAACNRRIV